MKTAGFVPAMFSEGRQPRTFPLLASRSLLGFAQPFMHSLIEQSWYVVACFLNPSPSYEKLGGCDHGQSPVLKENLPYASGVGLLWDVSFKLLHALQTIVVAVPPCEGPTVTHTESLKTAQNLRDTAQQRRIVSLDQGMNIDKLDLRSHAEHLLFAAGPCRVRCCRAC